MSCNVSLQGLLKWRHGADRVCECSQKVGNCTWMEVRGTSIPARGHRSSPGGCSTTLWTVSSMKCSDLPCGGQDNSQALNMVFSLMLLYVCYRSLEYISLGTFHIIESCSSFQE